MITDDSVPRICSGKTDFFFPPSYPPSPSRFKRRVALQEVEDITRTMLLYCSKCYNGDDRIKSFIWDLITPPAELGKMAAGDVEGRMTNHMGLNNPVPRGRRRKKPTSAAAAAAAATSATTSLGGDEDSMTGEMNGGVTSAASGGGAGGGGGQGAKPPAGDWLAMYDHHLLEEGYKRHLQRHANKYVG